MEQAFVPVEGLSQVERVVDTFVAPRKTFADILRSSSWWLPFVVMLAVGFVFNVAVDKKVGFDQIAQQQMEKNKFIAERFNALPADQKAAAIHKSARQTKVSAYFSGIIILIFGAFLSLLWWASLNFGLGAETKYKQIYALWMYAGLPKAFIYLISAGLLFADVGVENFDMQNPLGTNPGYYLGLDSSAALKAVLSFFDLFGLWAIALAVVGAAIIARKKATQTALVIVGWWVLGMLLLAGMAAMVS